MRRRHVLGHDVRPALVAAAFLLLACALAIAARTGAAWWAVPAGVIVPDLTFLAAGSQQPAGPGLMPTRAIRPYNALHHPAVALAGVAAAAALDTGTGVVVAVAWLSHIVWDRSVGYTLRDRNGALVAPAAG